MKHYCICNVNTGFETNATGFETNITGFEKHITVVETTHKTLQYLKLLD
jgi:hypothetical protein